MAFWNKIVKTINKPFNAWLVKKQTEKKAKKDLLELQKSIDEYIVLLVTASKTENRVKDIINAIQKMRDIGQIITRLELIYPHCGKKMQNKLISSIGENIISMSMLETKVQT